MSENRPKKRKIEFIESYWTGGEIGSDYQWNDNHGELIRCKDCIKRKSDKCLLYWNEIMDDETWNDNWFCADGEREDENV